MGAKSSKTNHKQFTIKNNIKYRKYYKTFIIGSGAFLIAFLVSSIFAPVQESDASEVTITNSITGYELTISSADTIPISVGATPGGQLAAAKDVVNVKTNSPNGYKLYLSTSGNDTNIYKSGSSDNASMGYFSATSGTVATPTALTQNTWGFALDKSTGTALAANFADVANYHIGDTPPTAASTWAGIPTLANAENNKISELASQNIPDGTSIPIFFGVNASTTLPSGDYTTEITYTAFSEGVNLFPYMQDFTAAECNALNTDQSINLSDKRDGKYYRVTKLKDGNCWMTENLALDGTDLAGNPRLLTSSDSNVSRNRYLTANIVNGEASSNSKIQIYSGSTDGVVDNSFATTTQTASDGTKMPYGNLYNFMAATAGVGDENATGEITESVCPKGWRLPTNTGDYSYSKLMGAYGLPTENTNGDAAVAPVAQVQQTPLLFPLPGRYYPDAVDEQGITGTYWSRTAKDADNAYEFLILAEGERFDPQDGYIKSVGRSVRCVFTLPKLADITTMQAMTTDICNATAIGETASLTDTRGGYSGGATSQSYGVIKAKDGNCWMTDNLTLYNKQISSSDSDLPSGTTFTIPDTSTWATSTADLTTYVHRATTAGYTDQVYYNWCSAVAVTANCGTSAPQQYSICPKNWQLPNDGDVSSSKTFAGWASAYEVTVEPASVPKFNYAYPGYWYSDGARESSHGSTGRYWSSVPLSTSPSTGAWSMVYKTSGTKFSINGDPANAKLYGYSVRCVAR